MGVFLHRMVFVAMVVVAGVGLAVWRAPSMRSWHALGRSFVSKEF